MNARARIAALAIAALVTTSASAKEVAGVNVPDTITLADSALTLNGAGVRSRFFVKVYVGALYVGARQTTAAAVLAAPSPRSVRLHILYDEISAAKLVDAWNDGFKANLGENELAALQPRIARFNALFPTVRKGEVIRLDMIGDTTEVWINDQRRGAVAGPDFQEALLKIWLGDKPVDGGLKQGMLGG